MLVGQPEFPEFANSPELGMSFPEFVDNPEPRVPVVLLLDTSGSMGGAPIAALNRGIEAFRQDVLQDATATLRIEVAVVSFGPDVKQVQDFKTIDHFEPLILTASGGTPMGEGINLAIDLLEGRKGMYKSNGIQYYQPWLFMVTDGAPNPTSPWRQAAQRLQDAEDSRKLAFFAVGVEGADMPSLQKIATAKRPPLKLKGLDFSSMFIWLSQSMSRVSASKIGGEMVGLPPVGWGEVVP